MLLSIWQSHNFSLKRIEILYESQIYFGHIVIKRCAQYFSTTLLFQKCYLFQQVLKTVFKRYFLNVFWQLWTCCDLFWKSYDKFSPKKRCKRFRTKRFSEKLLTKQLVCTYVYMTCVHKEEKKLFEDAIETSRFSQRNGSKL